MSVQAARVVEDQDRFQKQFRYHHGNLRCTLIEAALAILEEEGIEALSLRSIARKSNVSQAAPYSHFENKHELISAIAEAGFQRLALQMAEDAAGAPSVTNQIEKLVLSYVSFAKNNKPLFQLMFSNEMADIKADSTLALSANKGLALITAALEKNSDINNKPYMALAVWSLCHGLTSLIISGKISPEQFGATSVEEMVKKSLNILPNNL